MRFLKFLLWSFGIIIICTFCVGANGGEKSTVTPFQFHAPFPVFEPTDNQTTIEGVALGKKLFYDKLLSKNHTVSCSTCHSSDMHFTDGLALSVGINGRQAKRNSMPLFNLGFVDNYFWDGRVKTLEDVFHFPLTDTNEMGKDMNVLLKELAASSEYKKLFNVAFGSGDVTEERLNKALAQYIRTLISFNAPIDSIEIKLEALKQRKEYNPNTGTDDLSYDIKTLLGYSDKTIQTLILCEKCHSGNNYGNELLKNNGLDSNNEKDKGYGALTKQIKDEGLFKAPSLRNLPYTAPYMHDGRFKTLEEVIEHYNSGIQLNPNLDTVLKNTDGTPIRLNLSSQDKKEILHFLQELLAGETHYE